MNRKINQISFNSITLLLITFFLIPQNVVSMEETTENEYLTRFSKSFLEQLDADSDSDSEDDKEYFSDNKSNFLEKNIATETIENLIPINKINALAGKKVLFLFRATFFLDKEAYNERKKSRRKTTNYIWKNYLENNNYQKILRNVLTDETICRKISDQNIGNKVIVDEKVSEIIKKVNNLSNYERYQEYQQYKNQYKIFIRQNGICEKNNPFVSTSQKVDKAKLYILNPISALMEGKETLIINAKYKRNGQLKHPYIGKIEIFALTKDNIRSENPFFVVYEHNINNIQVYTSETHANQQNYIADDEVIFTAKIPAKYKIFSEVVRLPNFNRIKEQNFADKYTDNSGGRLTKTRNGIGKGKQPQKNMLDSFLSKKCEILEQVITKLCENKQITRIYKDPQKRDYSTTYEGI